LSVISRLRDKARSLKRDAVILYFAIRDPRTPLIAKLVAGLVVAYALSPIDLIPDFIPVLGYLDEIILIPLGIALSLRLIPEEVLIASRVKAASALSQPKNYVAAGVIVLLWILGGTLLSLWIYRSLDGR
jgi:uncharacterized membrane protein YkvA (DUF1232 family)